MADPPGNMQAKSWVSHLILFLLFLSIWVCLLEFPVRHAGVTLDDSWQKAFGYFLKKGMQAGTDFVFTYGPLGYFNSPMYHRELYWAAFFWELITRSLLIYYLVGVFQRPFNLIIKIVFLILIILFLPIVHRDVEQLIFIALIGIHLTNRNCSRIAQMVGLLTLSALSLGKFVLLLLSSTVALLCEIRERRLNSRSRFSPILVFLVVYCLGWIFARQSLMNLPIYLFSSLQIAVGYNESMAITGELRETLLSICILFLFLTILTHIGRHRKEKLQILIFVAGLLLAWKHGFTRQDNHTVIFFGYALVSLFLVVIHFGYLRWENSLQKTLSHRIFGVSLVLTCILGSIIGVIYSPWSSLVFQGPPHKMLLTAPRWKVTNNLRILTSPLAAKNLLDREEGKVERNWLLPLISSRVENSTIDVMSYQQGFIFLNRMNWRPRPVFQSYSAYTGYLAKRNADFFRGPFAPEYLLFKSQPLDNRLPATEDGLALFEILQRYIPDSAEQSFLLLKKQTDSTNEVSAAKQIRKQAIRFDQEIKIDNKFRYQRLQLDIRDTIPGKIRKLFFRPSYIHIKLKMKTGMIHKYRLVPALARNGFLLTPLIRKTADLIHFYQPVGGHALESFSVETMSPGVYFQDEIGMELSTVSAPVPSNFSANQFALLRDAIDSGLSFQMKDLEEASQIVPLDISERAAPAYDHLALFGEGLFEADPVFLPEGKYKLVLVGYGSKAGKEFPKVEFYMDRKLIGTLTITKLDQYELRFQITEEQKATFGLSFINDDRIGEEDRNVFIKRFYVERF